MVEDLVRQIKRTRKEVFMPLVHKPGEAQVDFFEALARIDGVQRYRQKPLGYCLVFCGLCSG